MTPKKRKILLILTLVIATGAIAVTVGLRFFPFSKIIKMPSGQAKEIVRATGVKSLSPNTIYLDFELPEGKELPGGFYKGLAHSGRYSVKAFGQNSFSFTVEKTAGEIGLQNLGAVALSAWIYVFPTTEEVKGAFVFTASNELGVNVIWQGVNVREPGVPKGEWFKISGYFDLSAVVFKPGYKLQVYFWNTSSTDILIDDYFMVFGKPVDRRGDSAFVDLTRPGGYTPRINYPPYPVNYLEKDHDIPGIPPSEIGREDLMVSGNFLGIGADACLVIRKNGSMTAFSRCGERPTWVKTTVTKPVVPITGIQSVFRGKFLGTSADQLLLVTERNIHLCALKPLSDPCPGDGKAVSEIKILHTSSRPAGTIVCGDFTGVGASEILAVAPSGAWKRMAFHAAPDGRGQWKVLAEGAEPPIREWNTDKYRVTLHAGRFHRSFSTDQVLTVARNKSGNGCTYGIHRFSREKNRWEALFPNDGLGRTIGIDTLKPEDHFYVAASGGQHTIFRYNRDWRFDLTEITFNDTTFLIRSGIDFRNYDADQNPKYYEMLNLCQGQFTAPGKFSFLVSGKNAPGQGYEKILPDFIHLYRLTK